jgi:heptosyltransferase-2
MIFNSRAKIIIGINSQLLSGLYDRFMVPTFKDHLSEQYINLANLMLGKQFKYAQDNIVYKADSISKILIHPLAGWKAKEWNLSKFMKLGEILAKEYQVDFILPRGSFPKDILQEICLNNINVKITNSFEELISEIKSCCLLICNDSGPGHIAGVLGKPTFTIFGPTNPGFHLPLYNHHSFISKQIKCSPGATEKMCFTNGGREGCPSFECVNRLSVEDVLDKLLKFITELNSITAFDKIANQSNDLYYQSNI